MIKLIVVVIFAFCLACPTFGGNMAWEDCGAADRSLIFRKVDLQEPLVIDSNVPLKMNLDFEILDPFDADVQLTTDLRRYFSVLGFSTSVKIPCINDAGSCSGPFCYFVQSYVKLARSVSEQLKVPLTCELDPGHFSGNIIYNVPKTTFARIPSVLLSAASGTYELVVRWTASNGHELGCLALRSTIDIRS